MNYDTWKLAYPSHWDDKPSAYVCEECGHEWEGIDECRCPACESTDVVCEDPEPNYDDWN